MIIKQTICSTRKKIRSINIITISVIFVALVSISIWYGYSKKRDDLQSYELELSCSIHSNDSDRLYAAQAFENIFNNGFWGAEESRSGGGSKITGALDWIIYLNFVVNEYHIRYIADIPCGDTNWQFGSRTINTIPFYFGGDISTSVISQNRKMYRNHLNKMFSLWDLVRCPIPTFSIKNTTGYFPRNTFDLIIVRDAIQHMNILNGLQLMKNIIKSGIAYFAVSSFPSQPCANFCLYGNISDGGTYANNMNCPPFSLPPPLLRKPSHHTIKHEDDEFHLYKIDSNFIRVSDTYDQACR